MVGWVRIHRKIRTSSFYRDSDTKAVWLECLLRAAYEDYEDKLGDKTLVLKPGQFTTGRIQISEATGISESKVQRILKWLESEHQIIQQMFSKYRLITIVNWEEYQSDEDEDEQQMNSKRTADEQLMNTKIRSKRTKERKKETPTPLPEWLDEKTWDAFREMRVAKKSPLAPKAEILAIGRLEKFKTAGHNPNDILETSTINGWSGFFPPDKQSNLFAAKQNTPKRHTNTAGQAK